MAFDVIAFLKKYSSALRKNDLQTLYDNCPTEVRGKVSEFLLENGVDVFKYLHKIPEYAFLEANIPGGVKIPATVSTIGKSAFEACTVSDIEIEDGVGLISEGAFSRCYNLKAIKWPESVTAVPARCFRQCVKELS